MAPLAGILLISTVSIMAFTDTWLPFSLLLALFASYAVKTVYDLKFHPLCSFPGPRTWAVSMLPWHRHNLAGRLPFALEDLHRRYGPVVRTGPEELSIVATDRQTWATIYNHRPDEMPKSLAGTGLIRTANGGRSLTMAEEKDHARMRKSLTPAFIDRAVREQEPRLSFHADKLIGVLREASKQGAVDMSKLFELTAFDITSDLTFGRTFGGLDSQSYHPWVATVIDVTRASPFLQLANYYNLQRLLPLIMPKHLQERRRIFYETAYEKVEARLRVNDDRKDFLGYFIGSIDGSDEISRTELKHTASSLVIAGSETSATFMAGFLHLILSHGVVHRKLREEIRSAFSERADISSRPVQRLEYLTCVINEVFRLYPPAPGFMPRVVPGKGEVIAGHFVPGGTVVGVANWSTYRSALNFTDPSNFVPERWFEGEKRPARFEKDNRDVLQPFSYGNRNCIGQRLANLEIRLILCHLLWEFDLELGEGVAAWMDQKIYLVWRRKPLPVLLRSRL